MKNTITLHKALTELKTLDSRIQKAYQKSFISFVKKGGLVDGIYTKDQYTKEVKANLVSMQDLIKRKSNIKKAIMKANSETEVEVGNNKMKIIDAINKKETIKLEKEVISYLNNQLSTVLANCNNSNEQVNDNLQRIIEVALGKDNVKTGTGEVEAISKPYLETNKFDLVDPIGLKKFIEEREKEIEEFETDIDSALSVINAITTIEV